MVAGPFGVHDDAVRTIAGFADQLMGTLIFVRLNAGTFPHSIVRDKFSFITKLDHDQQYQTMVVFHQPITPSTVDEARVIHARYACEGRSVMSCRRSTDGKMKIPNKKNDNWR
jgi:hypothetical protein